MEGLQFRWSQTGLWPTDDLNSLWTIVLFELYQVQGHYQPYSEQHHQLQTYGLKISPGNYATISDTHQPLLNKLPYILSAPTIILDKQLKQPLSPEGFAFISLPLVVVHWNTIQVLLKSVSSILLYSTWNSAQRYVPAWMGGESGGEWIHDMYMYGWIPLLSTCNYRN